ncbi:basic leucine zipper transcriptional factor ATF-like 2 [Perognathus longimembris pacificus]|uniref:basic leucine zipper transcriptional factor ATF-like 2 n=1 Tax=Perognathus longimembris pacificus TaxID=214514 RepID=UPI002018704A|nr:basic leucine zipper transcriptional factor ATF-like 2 [Perognathus longimembris pacificus]
MAPGTESALALPSPSCWVRHPEECQRQLKKKQKNRVAAQRSRQRHTDKADALHQQQESLEKHNHALRKEIQTLQAELTWWNRTLRLHEPQCPLHCVPGPVPLLATSWGQAEQPQRQPGPEGQHGCQEKPGSSPLEQRLCSNPQGQDGPGLFPSPPSSLSPGPAMVTFPSAQLCGSPVLSALPTGSNFLGYRPKLSASLPSPPAQPGPPQLHGLEHPTKGRPGSPAHSLTVALGPTCPQSQGHKPELSLPGAEAPRLGEDPGLHPLLAFPLLSSAQVHF